MVSGVKGDVYPSSLPHQFSRLLEVTIVTTA